MRPRNGTWSFDDHTTSTWIPSRELGIPGPVTPSTTDAESAAWDDPDEPTRKIDPRDVVPRALDKSASAADLAMDWDEDESTTHTYSPIHLAPRPAKNAATKAEPKRRIIQASPQPTAAVAKPRTQPAPAPARAPVARQAPSAPAAAPRLRDLQPERWQSGPSKITAARNPTERVQPSAAARLSRQAQLAAAVEQPRRVTPKASARPAPTRQVEPRSGPVLKARLPGNPPSAHRQSPRIEAPIHEPGYPIPRTPVRTPVQPAVSSTADAIAPSRSRLSQLHPGTPRKQVTQGVATRPPESAVRNAARAPRGRIQTYTRPVPAHREPVVQPPPPPVDAEISASSNFVYLVDDVRWHQDMPSAFVPRDRDPRTQPMSSQLQPRAPQPVAADLMPNARARYELPALQPAKIDPLELELRGTSAGVDLRKLAWWSVIPGVALFGAVLAARVLLADPVALEQARGALPAAVPQTQEVAPVPPPPPPAPAPSADEVAPPVAPTPAPESAPKTTRSTRSRSSVKAHTSDVAPEPAEAAPQAPPARASSAASDAVAVGSTKALEEEAQVEAAPASSSGDAAQGFGMLRLNSRPWSQVTIDGEPFGNTPLMGVRLPAGKHDVDMFNPAMNMRKKIQVTVEADDIVTRIVTLDE